MTHDDIRRFSAVLPRCAVSDHDCQFMVKSPGVNTDHYCIRCRDGVAIWEDLGSHGSAAR
jgi:hypothetical protein